MRDKNYVKAYELCSKNADSNHIHSMVTLGFLYMYGLGVSRDFSMSEHWLGKASEEGSSEADYYMGALCMHKNSNKSALRHFILSATRGYTPAKCRVGLFYLNGIGTGIDKEKAYTYFFDASVSGNCRAKKELAYMYLCGYGGVNKIVISLPLLISSVISTFYIALTNLDDVRLRY